MMSGDKLIFIALAIIVVIDIICIFGIFFDSHPYYQFSVVGIKE